MQISECSKLISLPIASTSLEDLRIERCAELESISSSQDLVSLKRVSLSECPKLTSLPIVSASLEDLWLYECEKLESISSSQDLVSLNFMKIEYCRKLTLFSTGSKLLKRLEIGSISNLSADAFSGLSSLESLTIRCMNCHLIPSVEYLTSLQTLELWYCPDLASLPVSLQLLKCLEVLKIWECHKITALSPEIKSCTSLKRLHVINCKGLISIETDIISSLTQLEELQLGGFSDELVEFPGFDETHPVNNPFLKQLTLYGRHQMKSLPYLGHLTALKELTIWWFGISELPIWVGQLPSLEELKIWGCDKITALSPEIKSCTSLKRLEVTYCKGLISIETGIISSLTQLEKLKLGPFSDELVEFPGFDETHAVNNPFLKQLTLEGGHQMKSVPYLGHLTALKELTIRDFGISELPIWVGQLSSLEMLTIWDCESLISLPPTMQQLSKLNIWGSPLLEQKFEEDRSALWPNISYIESFLEVCLHARNEQYNVA